MGKAWKDILHVAAEKAADVVVLGVKGRSTADVFFFGSTTQHVVRQSACPVLTIRSDDLDFVNQPHHLDLVMDTIREKLAGKEELVL